MNQRSHLIRDPRVGSALGVIRRWIKRSCGPDGRKYNPAGLTLARQAAKSPGFSLQREVQTLSAAWRHRKILIAAGRCAGGV